jgi:hypothetical protein
MAKRYEIEQVLITPEMARQMGRLCAWSGCTNHYQGKQPDGWRSLITFPGMGKIGQRGKTVEVSISKLDNDITLCPVHVREFKRLLGIDWDELMREAEGNA